MMLPWCFHDAFMMLSWCFHDAFMMLSVLSWCFFSYEINKSFFFRRCNLFTYYFPNKRIPLSSCLCGVRPKKKAFFGKRPILGGEFFRPAKIVNDSGGLPPLVRTDSAPKEHWSTFGCWTRSNIPNPQFSHWKILNFSISAQNPISTTNNHAPLVGLFCKHHWKVSMHLSSNLAH